MVTEIVNLMDALVDNSQTLVIFLKSQIIPEAQRAIIDARIRKNTDLIRNIVDLVVKEPINA